MIAVLLQIVVASQFTVLELSIDLFVIFTVIVAVNWGPLAGCVFGFVAGFLADVAHLEPLGLKALIYTVIGYVLGVLAGRLRVTRPRTILLYTLGASFAAQFSLGLVKFVMGPRGGFFTMLGTQMIPGAVLDAAFGVLIFVILARLRVISMPRADVGKDSEAKQ